METLALIGLGFWFISLCLVVYAFVTAEVRNDEEDYI
jgi:hypothetical protein